MTPAKPLPLDVPVTSTFFDLGERGHGLLVADLVLGGVLDAHLAQVAHRLDALLGEMASHGLVDLLGLDGAEAQLNGLVAVGGLRS